MLDLVEEIQSYSPQTADPKPTNPYILEPQPIKPAASQKENFAPPVQPPQQQSQQEKQTGISRFCKQKYYEEYFRVNEENVKSRIKAAVVPPYNGEFLNQIKSNPDFYGPFWIFTTLVLLLGIVGNFANYVLSKFSQHNDFKEYFFRLQLVRYAVTLVFSFGAGVPVILFFMFKFMKSNELSFPEISCLYGYAMSCYIPALVICIFPINILQWILMIYAFANSSLFLFVSLKKHIDSVASKMYAILITLLSLQLIFFLVCKLVFISLLGVSEATQNVQPKQ